MSKIADFVVKRKKVLVTMVLLLTVFFTICFFQVAINYNMTDYLPEHANSTVDVCLFRITDFNVLSSSSRWLDERKDLDAMLPRLRAYMGHYTLKETAYYVHLLPENLSKNKGIDWKDFSEIIPEVDPWQE